MYVGNYEQYKIVCLDNYRYISHKPTSTFPLLCISKNKNMIVHDYKSEILLVAKR